jgi:hypothetical protein
MASALVPAGRGSAWPCVRRRRCAAPDRRRLSRRGRRPQWWSRPGPFRAGPAGRGSRPVRRRPRARRRAASTRRAPRRRPRKAVRRCSRRDLRTWSSRLRAPFARDPRPQAAGWSTGGISGAGTWSGACSASAAAEPGSYFASRGGCRARAAGVATLSPAPPDQASVAVPDDSSVIDAPAARRLPAPARQADARVNACRWPWPPRASRRAPG